MSTQNMQFDVSDDKVTLGRKAAQRGAALIRLAIAQRGAANIIVATGSSQFDTIKALVNEGDIDWTRVTGFHLDEYVGMSITHPASFRFYLWRRFVSQLPLPLAGFHFVVGDAANPGDECKRVGEIIVQHPIDVAFVGIGENAHLAFNDPPADFETTAPFLVVDLDDDCRRQQLGEGWFPTLEAVPVQAISMSVAQIMKSASIICSVPDQRKAEAVRQTVSGGIRPAVPASILQRHRDCRLYLDSQSASLVESRTANL